jgi:hypothetical protein
MSDEPTTGAPPATEAPATQSVAAPAATTPPEIQVSELHEVFDKETGQFVKIGDAVEAYRNKPDPEALKKFQLMQKVEAGDPAALAEYADSLKPAAPTPEAVATAHAAEIKSLQDEMASLREQVKTSGAVTARVQNLSDLNNMATAIESLNAKDVPFLSKFVEVDRMGAAQDVMQLRQAAAEQVRQQYNRELNSFPLEVQQKVLGQVVKTAEQRLAARAAIYGAEPKTEAPKTGPVSVNDQTVPAVSPTHLPARIETDPVTGALKLNQQLAAPPTTQSVTEPLPATAVTPNAVGGGPPVVTDARPAGPYNASQLAVTLKGQVQNMNEQV